MSNSNDLDAVFDTAKVRQQVEAFDRSINTLTSSLERLDRTNVTKLEAEISRLSGQSSKTLSAAVNSLQTDFEKLNAALNSPRGNREWYSNVEQGLNKVKLAVRDLAQTKEAYWAEQRESSRNSVLYEVANATKVAQATKAAYTDLRTFKNNVEKAAAADYKSTLAARLADEKAAADASLALAQRNASFTAALSANSRGMLPGLSVDSVRRSAQESAATFAAEFSKIDNAAYGQFFKNFSGTLSSGVGKSARDSAGVFSANFADEAKRSTGMFNGFFNQLSGKNGPVARSASEAAKTFMEAFAAQSVLTKGTGSKLGGADIMGSYTPYNAMTVSAKAYKEEQKALGAQTAKLGKAFNSLQNDGNDLHSMSRGLASGFNMLWLTWGNLVPLFIGAGISNGFMQVVKTGMEVQQTMATIEHVGGATRQEMALLNEELLRLANSGPAGPAAIAEAMKTLSLAGLKANEILAVTQDVLNFSVAGTTDIKTAADTLVSVSTAFGLGAAGFGRVSDVISKAAAESKTSVEGMAAAMRAASVIGKQYGVTLEDTATSLAAMSQLGIDFSSAGTALRNMYADLSGRSEKTSKILKAQGIELRDVTGNFRPLIQVVGELDEKMKSFATGRDRANFQQALLSERGGKAIIELLDLINQKATETGKGFSSMLEQLQSSITDSAAFAAIAAAKMSQTLENQFKSVKATMQASFLEAFEEVAPELTIVADNLKKAFASEDFKSFIGGMVDGIGRLSVAITENIGFITTMVGTMAILKVSQMAVGASTALLTGTKSLLTIATAANTAATATNTASKEVNAVANAAVGTTAESAAVGVTVLSRAMSAFNVVLGLATAAWVAYEFFSKKANNATGEAAKINHDNIAAQLAKQIGDINTLNLLREKGNSLKEAQAKLQRSEVANKADEGMRKQVEEASAAVEALETKLESFAENKASYSYQRTKAQLDRATDALGTLKTERTRMADDLTRLETDLKNATNRQNELNARELEKNTPKVPTGNTTFSAPGKTRAIPIAIPTDNSLTLNERAMSRDLAAIKQYNSEYAKLLSAKHSAGTMEEGEYQAELFRLADKTNKDSLASIEAHTQREIELFDIRAETLVHLMDKAKAANNGVAVDKIKADLDNLSRAKADFLDKADAEKAKVVSESINMVAVASEKAAGVLKKVTDADREFWKKDDLAYEKLKVANDVATQFAFLNESILSSAAAEKSAFEARSTAMAEYTSHIDDMKRQLALAAKAADAFLLANLAAISTGDETVTGLYNRLREVESKLQDSIETSEDRALTAANRRAELAFVATRERQSRELTNSVSDALVTGLMEGGESGRKKFRSLLEAELRKPLMAIVNVGVNMVLSGLLPLLNLAGSSGDGTGAGGGGSGILGLISNGTTAYNAYNGFTTGAGIYGRIGSMLGFGSGTGVGASVTGVNGLSALTPVTIGTNSAAVAPVTAGSGSGGLGAMGTFGIYAAIAALIGNAMGMFRTHARVDSGLAGTLGSGQDLTAFDTWRTGGTLFKGPDYDYRNPETMIASYEDQLQRAINSGTASAEYIYQMKAEIESLKTMYADMISAAKAQSKSLNTAYDLMRDNVGDMADALGLSSDAVRKFTVVLGSDIINSDTGAVGMSFKGLTDEQISQKIADALATANNTLAEQVIGRFEKVVTRYTERIENPNNISGENQTTLDPTYEERTSETTRYVASEYARDGEKAIDTLTRLATSLGTVNKIFDMLNVTLVESSLAGGDFASSLADLFGGLESMIEKFNGYYQNFYSADERKKKSRETLQKQLSELGMDNVDFDDPDARKKYRDAVEKALEKAAEQDKARKALTAVLAGMQLDKVNNVSLAEALKGAGGGAATPEALEGLSKVMNDLGKQNLPIEKVRSTIAEYIKTNAKALGLGDDAAVLAAALINLSGTFADVTAAVDETTGSVNDLAEAERERQAALAQAVRDAKASARATALEYLEAAINAEKEVLQKSIDTYSDVVSNLQGIFDLLKDEVASLYGQVASTADGAYLIAQQTIASALMTSRSGGKLDRDSLSTALTDIKGGLKEENFSSQFEYDRARLVLASQLAQIRDNAGTQLTTAEIQLKAAQEAVERLDDTLEYWRKQVAIADGTYRATLSVGAALNNLISLISGKAPGSADSGGTNKPVAVFGPGGAPKPTGSGNTVDNYQYKRPTFLGTSIAYNPITDEADIARLNTLSPIYHAFDGSGDLEGLLSALQSSGGTLQDLADLSGLFVSDWVQAASSVGFPAFRSGGYHTGGIRLVGEDGPELEVTGAAHIFNAKQTAAMLAGPQSTAASSGGGMDSAALQQLQAMRVELTELRRIHRRWDTEGVPEQRVTTPTTTP